MNNIQNDLTGEKISDLVKYGHSNSWWTHSAIGEVFETFVPAPPDGHNNEVFPVSKSRPDPSHFSEERCIHAHFRVFAAFLLS